MRRSHILLFVPFVVALFCFQTTWSQAPSYFKYQAVARDGNGVVLSNKSISIKIRLISNNMNGQAVYAEEHHVTTTSLGVANIDIGKGAVLSGVFSNIKWGAGPYFLETSIDPTGGSNYITLGTSQLVSVPYALYANYAEVAKNGFSGDYNDLTNKPDLTNKSDLTSLPSKTQSERDAIVNPASGSLVFNTTTSAINYWNGNAWYELKSACTPQPSAASAGPDHLNLDGDSFGLEAQQPASGTGHWSIVSGQGGSFSDSTIANATFTGQPGSKYELQWTVKTVCGSTQDNVVIGFAFSNVSLGSEFGGGIVFYLDGLGGGLIAATQDQSDAPWGCKGTTIGSLSPSLNFGQLNTTRIVSQCSDVGIAAKVVNDLDLKAYTDWYLPSTDELTLMYTNLQLQGKGNFSSSKYWSSTEGNDFVGQMIDFSNGQSTTLAKDQMAKVRAIRKF